MNFERFKALWPLHKIQQNGNLIPSAQREASVGPKSSLTPLFC